MNTVPTAVSPEQAGTGDWESEGGSLEPIPPISLPDGITAVTSIYYRVGPYSYSRLEDAMAELRRQSEKQGPCGEPLGRSS